MKSKMEFLRHETDALPGASFETGPGVLNKIIQQLLPRLADYPELIDRIQQYLMDDYSDFVDAKTTEELRNQIKRTLKEETIENIDLFVELIEGMKVLKEEKKLRSLDALDIYAQTHKNEFKHKLEVMTAEGKRSKEEEELKKNHIAELVNGTLVQKMKWKYWLRNRFKHNRRKVNK